MRVPFLRSLQNGFRFTSLSLANRVSEKTGFPLWVRQPTSVQFDTTIRQCILDCVYCNPQSVYVPKSCKSPDLPLDTIKHTCDSMNSLNWRVQYAHSFCNTDPLCDIRLHEINRVLKERLECLTLVSTNGVNFGRRFLLRDQNLNDVRFTISAVTPETYLKVHGKPYLRLALKTLRWLNNNKFWNQRIGVRFILFGGNVAELGLWQRFFRDYPQEIRVLHHGGDRKTSGVLESDDSVLEYHRMLQKQHFRANNLPCNCFHNLTVGYNGEVMQCCDLPYKYSWGHVEEVDLEEIWLKRLMIGLDHPGCRGCNQKNPNWRRLFEKYVW